MEVEQEEAVDILMDCQQQELSSKVEVERKQVLEVDLDQPVNSKAGQVDLATMEVEVEGVDGLVVAVEPPRVQEEVEVDTFPLW